MTSQLPGERRTLLRLRPRSVVSLAIKQGESIPPAYGILNDISERGAGIHSDRILGARQKIQLRIQFASAPAPFDTEGRVAWICPAVTTTGGLEGGALTGVEFDPLPGTLETLRRLLIFPEFEPRAASPEFEAFLIALRPYLERLSDYLIRNRPDRARGEPPCVSS